MTDSIDKLKDIQEQLKNVHLNKHELMNLFSDYEFIVRKEYSSGHANLWGNLTEIESVSDEISKNKLGDAMRHFKDDVRAAIEILSHNDSE